VVHTLIAEPLTHFIAQVVAVVALSRLLGLGARRLGQPMVVAEMVAGILLGPSFLGWLWPEVGGELFSSESLHVMGTVSLVGLVLFMFLIGLELDLGLLGGRGRASVAISYASIAGPFALGAALALYLYDRFADPSVSRATFALFMGAFMSVTAFPVLARILTERRLLRSRVGAVTVACAAAADVTAWCILAFVVAAARASGHAGALVTTGLAILYVAAMLLLVRPLLVRLAARVASADEMSQNVAAVVLVLVLVSAWLTELMGIHAVFGAFLFGAILPRQGGLARALVEKLEDLIIIALVPLFFAYSGVRTQIGLLDSGYDWAVCGLILVVATLGKAGGGALAARLSGLSWREAGALGVLMNTRGLMGIIVLNIGLDLGVISTALFSMLIIMALVTTVVATPLLEWIYPVEAMARDLVEALEPPARAIEERVLVCVSHAAAAPGLLDVASCLAAQGARLVALHLVPTGERAGLHLDEEEETPAPLLAAAASAAELGVEMTSLSFLSPDPADDICRVAAVQRTDLVLLGSHRPLIGHNALGGTVGAVLRQTSSTVAVLVDRGVEAPRAPVVLFRGSKDDRAALLLAGRVAGPTGAVTVLIEGAAPPAALVAEVGAPVTIEPVDSLAAAVAARGDGFPIVLVGVEPDWTLVRDCPTSLLLVRGAAAARES
jgi:Kef-type K+ transport system membrane component KefB